LFSDEGDYAAFVRVLARTVDPTSMRLRLLPNYGHLFLWPTRDGELARFMQKLTITHVRRWVEHRHRVGYGGVYQAATSHFSCRMAHISPRSCDMSTAIRCGQTSSGVLRVGDGQAWAEAEPEDAADPADAVAGLPSRGLD
jgi:hypothetical protein